MSLTTKRLRSLGLGATLASSLVITACTPPSSPDTPHTPEVTSPAPDDATSQVGEGEGGVAIAAAATDPIVFNTTLAITEAHIVAARDAHAVGETAMAAEMFAHPVSEVLFDMEPVFEARGVPLFDTLLIEASHAVLAGESKAEIAARTDAIIAALHRTSTYAPDNGASPAIIAAGVVADQIERASDMYRAARDSQAYEPYLDGYGFYRAGASAFVHEQAAITAANPRAATAITDALDLLALAYPDAARQTVLDADTSALAVAASNVVIAVSN